MHRPISVRDMAWIEHTACRESIDLFGKFAPNDIGIDHPIDNNVTDVNPLGA